jgi:transposase/regulator of replication initiation timing
MKSPQSATQHIDKTATSLATENDLLRVENQQLKHRVEWFEKQLFGQKSEKRLIDNPHQPSLLGEPVVTEPVKDDKVQITYQRGTAKKQRPDACTTDTGLRFSDEVPVEVIAVTPAELLGAAADDYEIIDTRVSHKLAQRPSSYVVLRYETPVIKHKEQQTLITTAMPDQVLDNSIADVSVLVGLLVDKFLYHLPLYRQHQRLEQVGITVARPTLTNWVKRAIELLRPIVDSQLAHLLQSKVLAMDETPIKAGRKNKGKMQQAYFWPIYGEEDEIVFTYNRSRGRQQIEATLATQFQGTLVTDGYAAYARYVEKTAGVTHAQCWIHSRRKFVEAESSSPQEVAIALEFIGQLYQCEKHIQTQQLNGDKKHQYRLTHSKPVVDAFYNWCQQQCQRHDLTPTHPLTKALNYVRHRETALRVFLEDPDVPMDTNHLERALRPIPMGRKNWLFCWTELGAEHVGLIQSLISTCKLQDINPHTYLTDVLQRVGDHPASKVEELTPRVWKEKFAGTPMRSVLDRDSNSVVE